MKPLKALLVAASAVPAALASCPAGWMGGDGTAKCMLLLSAPATHQNCALACASAGGSLACLQSQADDSLAGKLSPTHVDDSVWVGEYQWPFEHELRFGLRCTAAGCNAGVPHNGQPGWGLCSNGQTTNYTSNPMVMGFSQPNNFNAGEDCMAKSPVGYFDSNCAERLPCLCEHGSQESPAFLLLHGPALMGRARAADSLLYDNVSQTMGLAALYGSIPAILLVLIIECYYIRWRQRAAATTKAEAALQASIRLALRRQMRQAGLSLWLGGVLFALSIPPTLMFKTGAWPSRGCCHFPAGMPIHWKMLQYIGVLLILLTIRPSETTAVRLASVAWPTYVIVMWYLMESDPPFWLIAPREDGWKYTLYTLRGIGIALSLRAAIFWRRHALPSRRALRWLWNCVRLDTIVSGIEFSLDCLPFMDLPISHLVGTPMIAPAAVSMTLALVLTPTVRQFIRGVLGGVGARAGSAATVVQTMVTGDAVAAIRDAHDRMYCIRMSSLGEADMANNKDSGLFAKTEKAAAGEVDAFLSHSWRDDAALKWARMQEFKQEFEARHGGAEPRCWLDKACIDQAGDINASLRALPIFLLASKYFVVFVGDSYMQRLWCMVELFTFVTAGCELEQIVLKPLSADHAAAAVAAVDIWKADCREVEDKERMRAIVEASYGSFGQFNDACRRILQAKLKGGEGEHGGQPILNQNGRQKV